MEARCWQVTQRAGNRPSGPQMFSKRQDEEKWTGTEVANKCPVYNGASWAISREDGWSSSRRPCRICHKVLFRSQDLKCSSHNIANLEERHRLCEHISKVLPDPSFTPCPSSLLSTCFPLFWSLLKTHKWKSPRWWLGVFLFCVSFTDVQSRSLFCPEYKLGGKLL